ncbi:MAG: response regulator transcription factor [bacterium]|nr:response regulator transcription factor [bacterium]
MSCILLVEDDAMIASGLKYALEQEHFPVYHAANVADAIDCLENKKVDLAILDMQLPDGTGFDVSERLKGKGVATIFLTVVDDEENIVKAFERGADDYVIKPFRIRELIARVKRTLLKMEGDASDLLTLGQVQIDTTAGKVYANGQLVELTSLEYRLLLIFAENKGVLLSRTRILEKIWDIDGNFVEDNTLTVYVKRLREKLGDAINIETVRGMGYRVD